MGEQKNQDDTAECFISNLHLAESVGVTDTTIKAATAAEDGHDESSLGNITFRSWRLYAVSAEPESFLHAFACHEGEYQATTGNTAKGSHCLSK